jgi:hypothetical protein
MYGSHKGTLFGALVFACVLIACAASGSPAQETRATLTPDDDFRRTMDAHNAEKDKEAQFKLWFAFLERNPDTSYSVGTINYLVGAYFIEHRKDPEAGIEFLDAALARITDDGKKSQARRNYIGLHAARKDGAALRALRAELEAAGGLSLQDYGVFADGFATAGEWAAVRDLCAEAEGKLTAEFVRAQNPNRKMTDEQVKRTLNNARAELNRQYGRAFVGLGDLHAAIGKFAEASKYSTYNYAGVAYGGVTQDWAKALIATGDLAGALKLLAPEALIYGDAEALKLYKQAWTAAGNDAAAFAAHLEKARAESARPAPDFTAFGYDGNPVTFAEVKGEVTFLGFWFPT